MTAGDFAVALYRFDFAGGSSRFALVSSESRTARSRKSIR